MLLEITLVFVSGFAKRRDGFFRYGGIEQELKYIPFGFNFIVICFFNIHKYSDMYSSI